MVSDVKPLFMCMLDIAVSSFVKCMFKSFTFFGSFLFLQLSILALSPLSDTYIGNISPSLWLAFWWAEVLNFLEIQFIKNYV